jgi:PA domain-containing protein
MARRIFPNAIAPLSVLAVLTLLGALLPNGPLAPPAASAATITIVNADGAGEGFNDTTPATPVGGNPGTTVGAQRLYVFQTAAGIWASILRSNVEIRVSAQFGPLTPCDASSGVLGSAGPTTVHRDFPGALIAGAWYHQALANKLTGSDLDPQADINANFNSSVGTSTCLTPGWYYGIDGNEGTQIELLPVVLHEIGHGLGFSTTTNGQTGLYLNSFPHVWDFFLFNPATGLHWNQMNQAQRAASATSCGNLVWDGAATTAGGARLLGPKPNLHVNSPAAAAGDYDVGTASFGPPLSSTGVTGDVVLANDGTGVLTNACEPLINVVAGKIVLLDRGGCTFVVKVKNAQNAGAIGVIVADSVAGCPPAGLGGSDPTITIPSVRISQSDGVLLKANLTGMNATLIQDPTKKAGTHVSGRVKMYAPLPYAAGSSVSHWDVSAEPNLLMEPAINTSLSSDPDLTMQLFADIGWLGTSGVEVVENSGGPLQFSLGQSMPNPGADLTSVRFVVPSRGRVVMRLFDVSGRLVRTAVDELLGPGAYSAPIPTAGLAGGVYFYRLEAGGMSLSRRLAVLP